jgi:hypothetical protein
MRKVIINVSILRRTKQKNKILLTLDERSGKQGFFSI